MLELLANHGLMALDRIPQRDLVPPEVLEAAQRKSLPHNRFFISPPSATPYQPRTFKRNVADLKRLSESVLPSRAIRLIRNSVASLDWGVQPKKVFAKDKKQREELTPLIEKVSTVFESPNTTDDDFQSFIAPVVEDILIFDAGSWEYVPAPRFVPNNTLLSLEILPGYSLAHNLRWNGDPRKPRWVQVCDDGTVGEQFLDSEIEYLSMRKRSWTPFGLSPLETVIDVMDAWLGITSYQKRLASDAYPPIMLHFGGQGAEEQIQQLRSYWENDLKGRGTPGLIGGFDDVEVMDLKAGGDERLFLAYQEMLVRTISFAFDLKPLDFSIERDVNRTTAEVQRISSLREGPKTIARLIQAKMNQRVLPKIAQVMGDQAVLKLEFFWLNIDPADDLSQAQTYEIYVKSEVMLPDEVRAELDLDPRTDGLGMMSMEALKQLYSLDPTANRGKPKDGEPIPFPMPKADEEDDEEEQVAASSTAADVALILKRLEEMEKQPLQAASPPVPAVQNHHVNINVPNLELPRESQEFMDFITERAAHQQASVDASLRELQESREKTDEVLQRVEQLSQEPERTITKRRIIRNAAGLIAQIEEEITSEGKLVAKVKKVVKRDENNQITEVSEE